LRAPHSFPTRRSSDLGDRLVYSNGIVLLATFAALLLWYFKASTTELIELYIVGVFISFTTSQLGMVRHWTRHLKTETDAKKRRQDRKSTRLNSSHVAI